MSLYVLKTFDPSGRLTGRVEFRSGADDEAMAAMLYLIEERASELWCGPRLVTTRRGWMTGGPAAADAGAAAPKRRPGRPPIRPAAAV